MRQITRQAVRAFENGLKFASGNTYVRVERQNVSLYLHGNLIAFRLLGDRNSLRIQNCGWFSNTTKERLNGLTGVSICQKAGEWYLNGKKWDGELVNVQEWTHGKIFEGVNAENMLDFIIAWEQGELDDKKTIALFKYLIKSGQIRGLQGTYQRFANALIAGGYIQIDEKAAQAVA